MTILDYNKSDIIISIVEKLSLYIDSMEIALDNDIIDEYDLTDIEINYNNEIFLVAIHTDNNQLHLNIFNDEPKCLLLIDSTSIISLVDKNCIEDYDKINEEDEMFHLSTINNFGSFTLEQFKTVSKHVKYLSDILLN